MPAMAQLSPRHCERSEAIHSSSRTKLDCFVAEPVIGRAFARPVGFTGLQTCSIAACIADRGPLIKQSQYRDGASRHCGKPQIAANGLLIPLRAGCSRLYALICRCKISDAFVPESLIRKRSGP